MLTDEALTLSLHSCHHNTAVGFNPDSLSGSLLSSVHLYIHKFGIALVLKLFYMKLETFFFKQVFYKCNIKHLDYQDSESDAICEFLPIAKKINMKYLSGMFSRNMKCFVP